MKGILQLAFLYLGNVTVPQIAVEASMNRTVRKPQTDNVILRLNSNVGMESAYTMGGDVMVTMIALMVQRTSQVVTRRIARTKNLATRLVTLSARKFNFAYWRLGNVMASETVLMVQTRRDAQPSIHTIPWIAKQMNSNVQVEAIVLTRNSSVMRTMIAQINLMNSIAKLFNVNPDSRPALLEFADRNPIFATVSRIVQTEKMN